MNAALRYAQRIRSHWRKMDTSFSPFFQSHYVQRLDVPHQDSHGDPWGSEEAFPDVFRWRRFFRSVLQFLPVVGMGSYYPHLFLALAADYFFRSFVLVVLGVLVWSVFVELPVYFLLDYFNMIPRDKSLWKTFVVYDVKKPTLDQIRTAISFKTKYEKPSAGEFYGVFAVRTAGVGRNVMGGMREDMAQEAGTNVIVRVFGITYHKLDFASYVLYALPLDIVVGIGGAFVSWYLRNSFLLDAFRPSIDGHLAGQFVVLYFIVSHLVEYWGWIFGSLTFGYIFAMGAWNSDVRTSWTPYLVFFGVTLYYWIVFFRNPIPLWVRSPWTNPSNNPYGPSTVTEIVAGETVHERHIHPHARTPRIRQRKAPLMTPEDEEEAMEALVDTAAAHTSADYAWSWWLYSAMNYETYGYNAFFGSLFLLLIIAIIGLVL